MDALAANPEAFLELVAVSGRVLDASSDVGRFVLGCEDACVRVPVRFSGEVPRANTDVVVRGRVARNPDGLFVLEAESVACR